MSKRPELLALVGALAITNEVPEERGGKTYGDWAESILRRLEERGYRIVAVPDGITVQSVYGPLSLPTPVDARARTTRTHDL